MSESIPSASAPKGEKPRRPAEEVLSIFRALCETESHVPHTKEERISISHRLHENLDELNSAEMIHKYEDGTVPTYDSLSRAAETAIAALLADQDDPEAARLAKLIEGQVQSIRTWCRRYVGTVIRFHRAKSTFFKMDGDEVRDALATSDAERRRVHDSLLSSLATFNELLSEAQAIEHFPKPLAWRPGFDLPAGVAHTHAAILAPEAIADRNLIKDWAIAADCIDQLKAVVGFITEESEKAASEESRPQSPEQG